MGKVGFRASLWAVLTACDLELASSSADYEGIGPNLPNFITSKVLDLRKGVHVYQAFHKCKTCLLLIAEAEKDDVCLLGDFRSKLEPIFESVSLFHIC